ncbi:MAG TPA: hypothetical protein VFN42_08045 [Acetobacteraceae bacterium]|nr:hypothetical protein [Acetobacteraceae bacterium]
MMRVRQQTVLHRTMRDRLAMRNGLLRAAVVTALFGTLGSSVLQLGIAQAQPRTLEPRQDAPSQVYLDLNTWCADYRPGLSAGVPDSREQKRLQAVQTSLAPGFDPGRRKDGIALLQAYRQVLEQRHPDRTLAATYLALTSTVPITFAVVERTNALLCVSSAPAFARAVADAAEAERREMAR